MTQHFKELSDSQWSKIESFMEWTPPLERGEKRTSFRKIWNSIFYILIHGCRWADLPKSSCYASKSTSHRWLLRLEKEGVLDRVLSRLLLYAKRAGKIDLHHLLVDGTFSLGSRGRPRGCSWL